MRVAVSLPSLSLPNWLRWPSRGGATSRITATAGPSLAPTATPATAVSPVSEHPMSFIARPASPPQRQFSASARSSATPSIRSFGVENPITASPSRPSSPVGPEIDSIGPNLLDEDRDAPHSCGTTLVTADNEAFALASPSQGVEPLVYAYDRATPGWNPVLKGVRQIKIGANQFVYALTAEGSTLIAINEPASAGTGAVALELPLESGWRATSFITTTDGSVAYVGSHAGTTRLFFLRRREQTADERRPSDGTQEREAFKESRLSVPATARRLVDLSCDREGRLYVVDANGAMWRGHPDKLENASADGGGAAEGWQRLPAVPSRRGIRSVELLCNGELLVQTVDPGKEPQVSARPSLLASKRDAYVLGLNDSWRGYNPEEVNAKDQYLGTAKDQATTRTDKLLLGTFPGLDAGRTEPNSLYHRVAGAALGVVAAQATRRGLWWLAQESARHTGRSVGWFLAPVALMLPTLWSNRACLEKSPAPLQMPGSERRDPMSRPQRWSQWWRATFTNPTQRGSLNARVRRELQAG